MTKRDRGVERGDHNAQGAREAAQGKRPLDTESRVDAADRHGHGAHGKQAADNEQLAEDSNVEPDHAKGSDGGSAGWGSEGSGGSVVDKRPNR
jgi:hypothetical protein